jgi:hypothetical protein
VSPPFGKADPPSTTGDGEIRNMVLDTWFPAVYVHFKFFSGTIEEVRLAIKDRHWMRRMGGGLSARLRQGFGAQPSLLGLSAEASAKAGFTKNVYFCFGNFNS